MRSTLAALFAVCICVLACAQPGDARTRTYYIAADEVIWNYAPAGHDLITGRPLPPLAPLQFGWSYHKAVYRGYTDASFKNAIGRHASDAYMGILGPIIHAEVGDRIVIVFKNRTRFPLSVHSHGMFYKKNSEGALYADGTSKGDKLDDAVAPGRTFTYDWQVPERAGPGPGDPSSIMWMYHSHTDEVSDVNTGPVGSIVITRRGMANPDGTPRDVDREIFALFAEEDESSSRYLEVNMADPKINPRHVKVQHPLTFDDQLYTINGFVFGNMPTPTIRVGERVRWYVMSTMSDFDFHTPHWHGNTLLVEGMRTDLTDISPMEMKIADMVPDAPGTWLFHCHVNLHLQGGMEARYKVRT